MIAPNIAAPFLDLHQLSIEIAREAYRKQFDIGQRTLLDLLDTENEYLQANRAYTNATYKYAIARARTWAGMGGLLAALQVSLTDCPPPTNSVRTVLKWMRTVNVPPRHPT